MQFMQVFPHRVMNNELFFKIVVRFTALGNSGHGSLLLKNTAGEKIRRVINKLMDMREEEQRKFEAAGSESLGEVTSINLNILEVCVQ